MKQFLLALRLARRELRGGLRGFGIFIACIALGVASIVAVGSLTQAFTAGLSAQGQSLLGGDAEFRLVQRQMGAGELEWLQTRATVSIVADMRGMARTLDGEKRSLVELKAVDARYPLFGAMELAPSMTLADALAERDGVFGAVVEPNVLSRLGIEVGGRVIVGTATVEIRAVIVREPDRVAGAFTLGPRLMLSDAALATTGLVMPGSLVNYAYRVALPGTAVTAPDVKAFVDDANANFPEAGWQSRDRANAAPGVRRFIGQVSLFLTLVGLAALIVGGVGVANAIKSYMDRKTEVIATLKCLGATGGLVFAVYLIQAMALAGVGIAIGLVLGSFAPSLVQSLVGNDLPIQAEFGIYFEPLILGAAYGFLTAFAFALYPLARAREISPARLFRDIVSGERRLPRWPYLVMLAAAFLTLGALAVLFTPYQMFALIFLTGVAAVFLLLRVLAGAVKRIARRIPSRRRPILRIALANLHRPGSATASVVLSLGLGLTLLVTVALIDGNIRAQIGERLPDSAPSFFFIDIQNTQVEAFDKLILAEPTVTDLTRVPMLRGRIVKLNGVPAADAQVSPDVRWALSGDRGITYGTAPPENAEIVAGEWWAADYSGPPLISFDADIAEGLGLKVGSSITVNVLGRDIEATISSLRNVDYSTATMNFMIIISPGVLESAPHAHLATARAAAEREEAIERAVVDAFPNVSVVRVKQAIETASAMLEQLALGMRAASLVTLVTGLLVLAGALAAGYRQRAYDGVILKVLGAERRRVLRVFLYEFAFLGLATATLASALGAFAAWLVVTQVLEADWTFLPSTLIITILAGTALTLMLGLVGNWRALSVPSARILRTN